jgi:hypothetical protein
MADSTLQQAVPCTEADYEAMKWRGYLRGSIRKVSPCAHGLRVSNESMPRMLEHVCYLIESAPNEADRMRERAADALRQIAAERGQS